MAFGLRSAAKVMIGVVGPACLLASSVLAQDFPIDPADPTRVNTQNEGLQDVGRTAETGVGEVGQRQTADDVAPIAEPMGRINNRINNRVQNRLRNRIDRNYDPTANATSPFEVADDQVRKAGSSRR